MAVYNGAATLEATVESILGQSGCVFEFVVINDGSSDASAAILDRLAARDARLRVTHQDNTGLTLALIRGCALASGEFIARQDCGDTALPGRLAAQAAYLRDTPDCVVVGSDYEVVGPAGELLQVHRGAEDGVADLRDRDDRPVRGPHHGTVMFRKSAYERAGGYRREFYFAQDVDLWCRMLEQGTLDYVPRVLCRTIFDVNGISGRHRPAQQALRAIILDATEVRRKGGGDSEHLERARQIRPVKAGERGSGAGAVRSVATIEADAAYFIGSCLFRRRDGRSRRYFRQVIGVRPFDVRSWAKLVVATLRRDSTPAAPG